MLWTHCTVLSGTFCQGLNIGAVSKLKRKVRSLFKTLNGQIKLKGTYAEEVVVAKNSCSNCVCRVLIQRRVLWGLRRQWLDDCVTEGIFFGNYLHHWYSFTITLLTFCLWRPQPVWRNLVFRLRHCDAGILRSDMRIKFETLDTPEARVRFVGARQINLQVGDGKANNKFVVVVDRVFTL